MLKISVFLFNTNVDLHESPTTLSCCNIISHQWWSVIDLNLVYEKLFNVINSTIIHDTTASTHQQVPCTRKNDIPSSGLIACCKLPPTLARQICRHNNVIGRNEYLISTLLETTFPWVNSLQFLFKSTHHSWRYERKCEWVFFSEHSVYPAIRDTSRSQILPQSAFSTLFTVSG